MAVEHGKFLNEPLSRLASDHKDRRYLQGVLLSNQAYVGKSLEEGADTQITWLTAINQCNELRANEKYEPSNFSDITGSGI